MSTDFLTYIWTGRPPTLLNIRFLLYTPDWPLFGQSKLLSGYNIIHISPEHPSALKELSSDFLVCLFVYFILQGAAMLANFPEKSSTGVPVCTGKIPSCLKRATVTKMSLYSPRNKNNCLSACTVLETMIRDQYEEWSQVRHICEEVTLGATYTYINLFSIMYCLVRVTFC